MADKDGEAIPFAQAVDVESLEEEAIVPSAPLAPAVPRFYQTNGCCVVILFIWVAVRLVMIFTGCPHYNECKWRG